MSTCSTRKQPAPVAAPRQGALPAALALLIPLALLIAVATISPSGLRAQSLPTGFALQDVVLEPFVTFPVGFAFLPDGRILLLEKDSGNVRLAAAGANTSAMIATIPGIAGSGERGLLERDRRHVSSTCRCDRDRATLRPPAAVARS